MASDSMREYEEKKPVYDGDINYCAICEAELLTDDPKDQSKKIDGLGFVCLSCHLKEQESQALQALRDLK